MVIVDFVSKFLSIISLAWSIAEKISKKISKKKRPTKRKGGWPPRSEWPSWDR